jgi:hypothetical protein
MRQRAQDTANDQARERRQRRLARNAPTRFANAKPKRDDGEAPRRKTLCRLTLEVSGDEPA